MISHELNKALAYQYGTPQSREMVKRAFDTKSLARALPLRASHAVKAECCVVFSDISGFSKRTAGLDALKIKEYLDEYYHYILPFIQSCGGLVDQMLGDGIISVYSPAFVPEIGYGAFTSGLCAAEKIVERFAGDERFTTKCAIHKDFAIICEIGDDSYSQATVIGEVMTIVHRLEAEAKDEAVNMLLELPEANNMYKQFCADNRAGQAAEWELDTFMALLKGVCVEEKQILYKKFNKARR